MEAKWEPKSIQKSVKFDVEILMIFLWFGGPPGVSKFKGPAVEVSPPIFDYLSPRSLRLFDLLTGDNPDPATLQTPSGTSVSAKAPDSRMPRPDLMASASAADLTILDTLGGPPNHQKIIRVLKLNFIDFLMDFGSHLDSKLEQKST